MRLVYSRYLGVLLLLAALLWCVPARAVESGLLGIPIGATPKELMRAYGPPSGVVVPGAGGRPALNSLRSLQEEQLLANLRLTAAPQTTGVPGWASMILPPTLANDRQMWIYRLKGNLSIGFIIKGNGEEAEVTDIVTASLDPDQRVVTERGIHLGDTFSQILLSYGYPPLIQPFSVERAGPGTRPVTAAGAGAGPGRGMGGGPGFRGGMGMRPGGAAAPPPAAPAGAGAGPLPTFGVTVIRGGATEQVAVVNQQPITFTKHCVILYDGLAFTLYNFKVVRIQITQ